MSTAPLEDARNFRKVEDRLYTAGQPSEAQLADAASKGVTVVLNLALHDDPRYSLRDEAGCVRGLGMDYAHIPVQFKAPTEQDLMDFFTAMDAHGDEKVLVHCAANYRVTAFVGPLSRHSSGLDAGQGLRADAHGVGTREVWMRFISEMIERHRR